MTASNTEPVVSLQGLYKEFPAVGGGTLCILAGVDLTLERGRSLAILGPSGSGKSTLLHILGTLETPTRGQVRVAGRDPFTMNNLDLARFRNREIGFVFQDHQLLPQCTALENVLLPLLAHGRPDAAAVARAQNLLKRVGLGERMGHTPASLSGGERQRVAIARALIGSPALLLCDEPTGNLDQTTAHAVADCFLDLQRTENVTLVTVTHATTLAARFDQRAYLKEGALRPENLE